jgi:hypothetical protein
LYLSAKISVYGRKVVTAVSIDRPPATPTDSVPLPADPAFTSEPVTRPPTYAFIVKVFAVGVVSI